MESKDSNHKFSLNHLPYCIHYDGETNTDSYFKPTTQITPEGEIHTCSFRGHLIKGVKVTIPHGYKGIVVQNINENTHLSVTDDSSEDALLGDVISTTDKTFSVLNNFEGWIEWSPEIEPSKQDPSINALSWIKVSDIIHECI
ncbi:Ribonuclease H2 subunit C [Smittium culicis]|uniref:Ribonuclease H2 subunit C n=1 Tax=Smittium culicis TaxID=133412 RepID=A0A1R1YDL8_9FUNG|nr:Ribonuclease H2 subunit C [Smittium culicis]OMJ25014.1 Ribonuclease H2 subunit C [Smittium culicis]